MSTAMTTSTTRAPATTPGPTPSSRNGSRGGGAERPSIVATGVLVLGALYSLIPIVWVLFAASKSSDELFSTFSFAPSAYLLENLQDLFAYRDGLFLRWAGNTALYAVGGALLSTLVSAAAGYGLALFDFRGKKLFFNIILAGVLLPAVILAVPQYLLFAEAGLANTYWAVLLPSILNPYGIYLARIYAGASVPREMIEAARTDGAGEMRIFSRFAVPMMMPGLVTVFLFQFVGIWNNYMLPYIMLGDDSLFPITVGLSTLMNQGASQPAMYTTVITGSLVSIIPLIALFLLLQRYWQSDLTGGAVKG
ncbi:carbohydrate ABC transporter membrane protein [Brachybacterium faecium DSM 4810]|uniref:Carbohydrate ABC transporter membrane protein n=1 Tax=Brachybacterium faecium (strain ATCC 43885 / DSM 4810 / JCM 11609 / LMG 19847 / NBRC 14762 / NCIMB 9860 / 6-10) TaxID=446465 RepID=C7MGT4_BRAFD|nr:carbohydrate ABC transporter permease [Brachybacterium faecium]ACU84275.1 carbohydrate ABC transporter membrane protein [Brachybacterium faecium DSM 4810]HJG51620.1 carbohydrate ABC transporter permease [Brachybacterium faecium]